MLWSKFLSQSDIVQGALSMAFNTFFWLILASGLSCLTSVMGCSSSSPYDDYKVSVTSVVDMTLWVKIYNSTTLFSCGI